MGRRAAQETKTGPEGNRREQQRLNTRNRLYEAAIQEFRRVGFDHAQIDRIVESAGVARGTFYFHFPTKEHVLREMQRRVERNVVKRLGGLRSKPASVRSLLRRVIETILEEKEAIGDNQLLGALLSIYVRGPINLDVTEEPLLKVLTRFFAKAAERGEVRSDLNPQQLTAIFGMLLFGLLLNARAPDEEGGLTIQGIIDFFIRGISP